ncbi:MAG TPA: PQQ-binding-like beta-propeller repeat protein [Capsulimonadaceae bacterium]|nr:PQQ-binding-like beta-propeller repeat protein [Capsulimonadaceae bacterium]
MSIPRMVRRPLVLLRVSLFGAVALVVALAASPVRASQAATYQLNAAHTGVATSPGLVPPLKEKWSVSFNSVPSYAAIGDGAVYVVVGNSSAKTTDVYALSPADGHTLWGPVSIKGGFFVGGQLAYDSGQVFMVDANGFAAALDAKTGAQNWARSLNGQTNVFSPPTPLNGTLYVVLDGAPGLLLAVDEATGKLKWAAPTENGDSPATATASAIFVNCVGPETEALNPANGALLWMFTGNVEGGGGSTAVFSEGSLYGTEVLGSISFGYRYNATTGAVKGTFDSTKTPAVDKTTGFLVLQGSIQAENMITQAILWTATLPAQTIAAPPIVINHVVYCVTTTGTLYGFDETTGNQLFSAPLGDTPSGKGLTAANGLLVVPTNTRLVAFH